MANVLNRVTKEYLTSVNTPDYSESYWVINPDLSNVHGVPNKYWKITGNTITEMDQDEKDAVDAALQILKTVVVYNPVDSLVSDRVTFIFPDIDPSPLKETENIGIDPSWMTDCDMRYYKYDVNNNSIIEMSDEEKLIVDSYTPIDKERVQVTVEIFLNVSNMDQAQRILNAIDVNGSFIYALDDHNYVLARYRLYKMLTEGLITIDDVFLADSKMPASILKNI